MIKTSEIFFFYVELALIVIGWFSLSAFCFPLVPLALYIFYDHWFFLLLAFSIPISLVLKYGFGVKDLWLLNDTIDGDFGDPKLLLKYDHTDKWKIFKFLWWWFRNHSWNFIRKFLPEWNAGEVFDFRIIKNTTGIDPKEKKFLWCTRTGIHGVHHIAYRVFENGKVYCRFSKATDKKERWYGCGGNAYKFKRKPAFF